MNMTNLKKYLQESGAPYEIIEHRPAYTAPEIAALAHVPGRDFAKTVIVEKGNELVMVVLPAHQMIDLADLRAMLGDPHLRLAHESEFVNRFPDCEAGAMPPFGHLYGLRTYVDRSLSEEPEIAFNACSHREVIKMRYADFERLAKPEVIALATSAS